MNNAPQEKSTMSLEPGVAVLLAYLLSLVGGIVIFMMEKENKFVRFHAMQSIILNIVALITFVILSVLMAIVTALTAGIGGICGIVLFPLLGVAFAVFALIAMIKGYQGEMYKIPLIGDFAEKYI